MLKNRDVFLKDPTTSSIPNLGVAKVGEPQTEEEWDVLRYELRSFVCDGEYRRGLHRILSGPTERGSGRRCCHGCGRQ